MTDKSPVEVFGDLQLLEDFVGDFEGTDDANPPGVADWRQKLKHGAMHVYKQIVNKPVPSKVMIDSRNQDVSVLLQRIIASGDLAEINEAIAFLQHRKTYDMLFSAINVPHVANADPADFSHYGCYRDLLKFTEDQCGRWNSYSLKYTGKIKDVCVSGDDEILRSTKAMITSFCQDHGHH